MSGMGDCGNYDQNSSNAYWSKANPQSSTTCPRFERFLSEVFNGDRALVDYLHRVIGYSLTGDTREQCWWMFYGGGSNGKSTLGRVGLIRFRGRFPKGGYDVPDGNRCNQHPATATTVHG